MHENDDLIIEIIASVLKNDTIESNRPNYKNWEIGYSHERITPFSDRLFMWKVKHIDEARKIVDYFKALGVNEKKYEGSLAQSIEWLFFYHK